MPSAIVDPVYDIDVSDDNQGYGIIDEEDPIKMMTRKSETEKRRIKAKKPISLVMERGNQGSNGKDCVKVVQEAVQVLQSVQGIFIMFPAVFVKKLNSC
jgi:hypothetical protein